MAPTDDILTLIHLVRQNPTLYNYKLQPNQRRRIDILNGWAEIAAAIGSKFNDYISFFISDKSELFFVHVHISTKSANFSQVFRV